mgnify:FL=1
MERIFGSGHPAALQPRDHCGRDHVITHEVPFVLAQDVELELQDLKKFTRSVIGAVLLLLLRFSRSARLWLRCDRRRCIALTRRGRVRLRDGSHRIDTLIGQGQWRWGGGISLAVRVP